ncbi:monooxygenase family protein [Nocardia sp. NPDC101769]|uniref:monooxygenase family protein n=1 Tax=Nocardia sp. NPDC101769 TaxID=3364333 RepID=UPI00381CBF12
MKRHFYDADTAGLIEVGGFMRKRMTVDLSEYPEPVVIYLGIKARRLSGLRFLMQIGPKLRKIAKNPPDGLLAHEKFIWGVFPLHIGFRQFWRDPDSLDNFARRHDDHRNWWRTFLHDEKRSTVAWHEAYFLSQTGVDALYTDMDEPIGFAHFAPLVPARGATYSSRGRAGLREAAQANPEIAESDLYRRTATD